MHKQLGDIISLEYGRALPADRRSGFGNPVFGSNGIVGQHEHSLVSGPGIIVGRKGSVGEVIWTDKDFWPIDTTYYVKSKNSVLHWVYHLLDWLPLERLDTSTGIPGLNRNDVYELTVYQPPKAEQRKIAAILDTVDAQLRKTEELIAKTETLKKGLLHDLLTRGIDKHGKLRPAPDEAPALYKQSSIGMIPKDWEVAALGQLLSDNGGFIQTGPFGSQLHAEEYVEDGVPVVMPQDMRDIEVCASNISMITESRAQDLWRHRVQSNDLLFSRRGDLARCSYISISNEGWLCGTGCLLLRPPSGSLDTFWFAHLYKQPLIQSQVLGMAVGSTMVNLNSTILANIRFPYPPIEEQRRISERIRTVSSLVYGEQRTLEKLKMEKEALMDDLLTGRVRVTPLLEKKEQVAV